MAPSDPGRTLTESDHLSPFGQIEGLERDDFREAAYEVFFTSCRSSPGFGGRSPISYYSSSDDAGEAKAPGVGMATTSRVKKALGLRMLRSPLSSRRSSSCGSNPSSPSWSGSSPRACLSPVAKLRRPKTAAEIMRQQMRVTEQSDNKLRKTLMRILVGQMGRRAETIILPLELLRHLKSSEFNDTQQYRLWQNRQLKILEAGLLLHPSIPLDKSDPFAAKFKGLINSSHDKPIDTGKNSDAMKTLCNCVVSLAWRKQDDVCHWADGYPLNAHFYSVLLSSVFDMKDETLVLDEVDELLELMKKTWSCLGINRSMHNICFSWVLFEQYVGTGEAEKDLLGAALAMLAEVAVDAKRVDREPSYVKMLADVLGAMKKWAERKLLDYHAYFDGESVGPMESILALVVSASKMLEDDVPCYVSAAPENVCDDRNGNRVDCYIRSSLRNAFTKMLEHGNGKGTKLESEDMSEALIKLARATEELAAKEKDLFSHVLKKWHPMAAGVAAVTVHICYGKLLKQYLASESSSLMNETVLVLKRAGKLEKVLVQMVVDSSVECEDGGKAIIREMFPYEVDSMILQLIKQWIQEMTNKGKELLLRAKETETWNPKSKTEPYAHSAEELVKFAKGAVDSFFEIPVNVSENSACDLAEGLEHIFRDYTSFVVSCGSKQSYMPNLPPLTRCNLDSKFRKLWKKAACSVGVEDPNNIMFLEGNNPPPSTSRGTQRLYIRLNSLHYLMTQLQSLDKTLSLSPKVTPSPKSRFGNRRQLGSSYFERNQSALQAASLHVSELAAYRLVFLDLMPLFYRSLYVGDVMNARIKPVLKMLRQNLTLLCAIVTDRAQPLTLIELVKASFEAYLMVLLAGGTSRTFSRSDHPMIKEDLDSLKQVFCTCGEGFLVEDMVEKEAEVVEGVVALMGQSTEQLVEDFSTVACEASGIGVVGVGQKLPMPPTTGRWNRMDPNTILRVLCYRNDPSANHFLKKTFRLAKRRGSI